MRATCRHISRVLHYLVQSGVGSWASKMGRFCRYIFLFFVCLIAVVVRPLGGLQNVSSVANEVRKPVELSCICSCKNSSYLEYGIELWNQSAFFVVDTVSNNTDRTFWELDKMEGINTVRVIIKMPDPGFDYSVLAILNDTFIQAGLQESSNTPDVMVFSVGLPLSGRYNFMVHKILSIHDRNRDLSPSVLSRTDIRIIVSHDECSFFLRRQHQFDSPPCQSLKHDALARWEGEWLGPSQPLPSHLRMRTGWSYLSRVCKLETFTTDDLETVSKSEKLSIAVLGTSRERGVFLSMVDMALRGGEKKFLDSSELAKCWGRASIRLNNLEFIYQDMRTHLIDPHEKDGTVTCHADKVATNSGMLRNATLAVNELMNQDVPPKVVLLFSACPRWTEAYSQIPPTCMIVMKKIVESFPKNWHGTIFVSTTFLHADLPSPTREFIEIYYKNTQFFSDFINDVRVRILDLFSLTSAMRLHAEFEGKIYGSTHNHRWCHMNVADVRVCSNVTEALANLVIARAVAPSGKNTWTDTHQHQSTQFGATNSSQNLRQIVTCYDCPESLLPFHIKPFPNLSCTSGSILSSNHDGVGSAWEVSQCPKECLSTKPVGKAMTGSGFVDIRVCTPRVETNS